MKHLEVLREALNIATTKGAFNLQEAAAIYGNLEALKQELEEKNNAKSADSIGGGGIKNPPKKG